MTSSSAPNGSSSSSTCGLRARQRASAVRCAMPPDNEAGSRRRAWARPDLGDGVVDPRGALGPGQRRLMLEVEAKGDVLFQREPGQEARVLEGDGDARIARRARAVRSCGPGPRWAPASRRARAAGWICRPRCGPSTVTTSPGASVRSKAARTGCGRALVVQGNALGCEQRRHGALFRRVADGGISGASPAACTRGLHGGRAARGRDAQPQADHGG